MALIEGKEITIEQAANTVTVSAIDASAAEVISGQTRNPARYRISRTGSTNAFNAGEMITVGSKPYGVASNKCCR